MLYRPAADTLLWATHESARRDRVLLERLQADDAAALEEFLSLYWAPLIRYATRMLESTEGADPVDDAEDVVQEAFVQLWQARNTCHGLVRSYLYGTARHLALDLRRHGAVRPRSAGRLRPAQLAQPPPRPDEIFDGRALAETVEHVLAGLPQRRREVFVLVRYHGMSYQETAEVMGISPQTVANQMSAALGELRRALESQTAEPVPDRAAPSDPRASTG
jgi:RNA polymerase sigma-70 factor (ECF subfamily)